MQRPTRVIWDDEGRRIHQGYRYKVNEKKSNQAFWKPRRSGHDVNYACAWSSIQRISTNNVICRDTDVHLILVHFISVVGVWINAGTAKKRKYIQYIRYLRKLHSLWGTPYSASMHWQAVTLPEVFSGHWKMACWKTFQKYPFLISEVGHVWELAPVEVFVCHLYGTPKESTINQVRLHLFGKAKNGL